MNQNFSKIVDKLKSAVEKEPTIHAMWIAGSVAEGYADKYSDIDLWLDIDDGHDEEIYSLIEDVLSAEGELDINFTEDMSPPYTHKVYRLKGANPYHFIEITLHSHSHKYDIVVGIQNIKVLFDKDNTLVTIPFDAVRHEKMLARRKKFLLEKIEIGELSVRKEIARNQFMDALHNYQFWLVEPIIELARIKHSPLKISYGLKHGTRDLPKDVTTDIESLYLISSLDNLKEKIKEIKEMTKKYS